MEAKAYEALLARVEALEAKVLVLEALVPGVIVAAPPAVDLLGAVPDAMQTVREALVAYNETAERAGLSKATLGKIPVKRSLGIKRCLKMAGGLEGWKVALGKVSRSRFLTGNNDRGWRANLDFLIREDKFMRVMEGGYDDDRAATGSQGLAPGGRGPSLAGIRSGVLAGIEAAGRVDGEGQPEF